MSKQKIYNELVVISYALKNYLNMEVEADKEPSSVLWLISDDLAKLTAKIDNDLMEDRK